MSRSNDRIINSSAPHSPLNAARTVTSPDDPPWIRKQEVRKLPPRPRCPEVALGEVRPRSARTLPNRWSGSPLAPGFGVAHRLGLLGRRRGWLFRSVSRLHVILQLGICKVDGLDGQTGIAEHLHDLLSHFFGIGAGLGLGQLLAQFQRVELRRSNACLKTVPASIDAKPASTSRTIVEIRFAGLVRATEKTATSRMGPVLFPMGLRKEEGREVEQVCTSGPSRAGDPYGRVGEPPRAAALLAAKEALEPVNSLDLKGLGVQ